MPSKALTIVIASTFLLGVAAWFGARYWMFGQFRATSLVGFVLAIGLVASVVRGEVFSWWLTFALSACGAYASFNLYLYVGGKDVLYDSQEITAEALLLPGTLFSLCSVLMLASLTAGFLQKRRLAE